MATNSQVFAKSIALITEYLSDKGMEDIAEQINEKSRLYILSFILFFFN